MDDIISTALWASLHSGGGSGANLDSVTFTENDTYTPTAPLDGWNEVTVQVPTYEEEYREALERIAELEEQVEECDVCKAAVIGKLQEYDPSFDPQTCTDIPPEIDNVVEQESGYTFPQGTAYDPTILDAVGADPITDVDTGQTLYCEYRTAAESIQHQNGVEAWYTDSNGDVYQITGDYDNDPDIYYNGCSITMHDPTTGTVNIKYTKRSHTYPDYHFDVDTYQTVSDLIGYGATGHTYKVHNT